MGPSRVPEALPGERYRTRVAERPLDPNGMDIA